MVTKLTLTLDNQVIKKAKKYARQQQISLSKLVEFYFKAISESTTDDFEELPPITKELSGIAAFKTKKSDKELLAEALNKKFS